MVILMLIVPPGTRKTYSRRVGCWEKITTRAINRVKVLKHDLSKHTYAKVPSKYSTNIV